MSGLKKSMLICAAVMITASLSSCMDEDDGTDGSFYAVIASNPGNLDPQLAEDGESFFIIRNIYATLMDIDGDGRIANGAAESYTVSEDGLVYTFTLREGLVWQGIGGEENVPLTAYDYEYAFKRIFSKNTQSPHRDRFSVIKNSLAVYEGAAPVTAFGVRAQDEKTLTIELSAPDCDFLKKLALPAASPCNEELFLSTQGRYGLSAEDTYACGAFYVTDWNYDPYWTENHIYLERIPENSREGYITAPQSVSIEITGDRSGFESKNNIKTDGYIIDRIEEYDKKVSRDYKYKEYVCKTTMLFFSPGSPIYGDETARKAIAAAIDWDRLGESLGGDSKPAFRIIPEAVTILNKSFRELYPDRGEKSGRVIRSGWDSFVSEHSDIDFNSYELMVSDSLNSPDSIYSVVSDLEEKLDLYCMAVFRDDREFAERFKNNDYDICAAVVSTDHNSADEFLDTVISASGVSDEELERIILEMRKSADLSDKSSRASAAEEYFIDKAYALPLSYEKKYLVYRENVDDLWYDPFTDVIFFKYAKQF